MCIIVFGWQTGWLFFSCRAFKYSYFDHKSFVSIQMLGSDVSVAFIERARIVLFLLFPSRPFRVVDVLHVVFEVLSKNPLRRYCFTKTLLGHLNFICDFVVQL